jgi:hypothetical protein
LLIKADTVSRVWRKVKGDWDTWNGRSLAESPRGICPCDCDSVCKGSILKGDNRGGDRMSKIFISYNGQSEAMARSLVNDIESLGYVVWFDRELSGGQATIKKKQGWS